MAEIDKASVTLGEDLKLEEERTLLVHAERLRGAAEEAYSNLYEDESSVLERLAVVWKRVSELAEIDPLVGAPLRDVREVRSPAGPRS